MCVLNRICKWFDDTQYEEAKNDIIRVVETFKRDDITLTIKESDIPDRLSARRIVHELVDTLTPLFPLPEGEDNILHHHIIAEYNTKVYRHGPISYLVDKYPHTNPLTLPNSLIIANTGSLLSSIPSYIYNSLTRFI